MENDRIGHYVLLMSRTPIHTLAAALAVALFAAAAVSPALAYCPSVPDGPDSYNVQNGTTRAVCQQGELATEGERIRQQSEMRALVQNVDRQQLELRQQQLELQQRLLPPPSLPTPTF